MLYFHQDYLNTIVFSNGDDLETGDSFKIVFLNQQFGKKELTLTSTEANSRYVSANFHVVSEQPDEDLGSGYIWLPTGFSTVNIDDSFIDKVFVEFKPTGSYKLVADDKKFVLE